MSGVYFHLLVNHAPIFGAFFALALLAASYVWAPDVLRRTGFTVLIATALAAAASDLSGDAAAHAVRGLPGVKRELIQAHDHMAGIALTVGGLAGLIALVLLVRARRRAVGRGEAIVALLSAVVVSGLMAYTGLLGGQIRHTEVRPNATAADAAAVEPPATNTP
jgi:hypothetical protein